MLFHTVTKNNVVLLLLNVVIFSCFAQKPFLIDHQNMSDDLADFVPNQIRVFAQMFDNEGIQGLFSGESTIFIELS